MKTHRNVFITKLKANNAEKIECSEVAEKIGTSRNSYLV